MTKFRDLAINDRFRFPASKYGPCVKISIRTYRDDPDKGYRHNVGTINVEVTKEPLIQGIKPNA